MGGICLFLGIFLHVHALAGNEEVYILLSPDNRLSNHDCCRANGSFVMVLDNG